MCYVVCNCVGILSSFYVVHNCVGILRLILIEVGGTTTLSVCKCKGVCCSGCTTFLSLAPYNPRTSLPWVSGTRVYHACIASQCIWTRPPGCCICGDSFQPK